MGSVVAARELESMGSVIVAHGFICLKACGIFPNEGSNQCPLQWQADSLTTGPPEKSSLFFSPLKTFFMWTIFKVFIEFYALDFWPGAM